MVEFSNFDFNNYYFAITQCFDSCISYDEPYNQFQYNHNVFDDDDYNIYFDSCDGIEPDHDDWFINWSDDDASIILAD